VVLLRFFILKPTEKILSRRVVDEGLAWLVGVRVVFLDRIQEMAIAIAALF